MDNDRQISELFAKPLLLTYQQYLQRGKTLKNLCIDRYLVSEKIGEGSYGSVFKGMEGNTKKQVAVKLIDLRQIKNLQSEYLRAVQLRLAQSQPKLMHMCSSPYLMKCYQAYENEDLKVMIVEYCEGKTLQAEIDQKTRIPQNEAWVILKHIINGLMELHRHRIVHRDLKAENIMSHNGTYKIIDFGFSKKLQIAQENIEVKNTTLGTITTMAPEVMGRRPYGLKADIWSLGIIFFQMCYGVYPYDSSNADKMYREVSNNKLFSSDEPLKFNGHTPSREVHRFLRFAIVVETSKRPDWKAVVEFLKKTQVEDKRLNQRFLKRCEVVYDGGLDCSLEIKESEVVENEGKKEGGGDWKGGGEIYGGKELEKENGDKKSSQSDKKGNQQSPKPKFNLKQPTKTQKQQSEIATQPKQKEQQNHPLNRLIVLDLDSAQLKLKTDEMSRDQDEQYQWVQNAHLQCLKTEFVFREIVNPLDITPALKKDSRTTIEFFYLLAARCFNNMSPIQDELEARKLKGKRKEMVEDLSRQVSHLYDQVSTKFGQLSTKLTESENNVKSMIFDWFSKNFNEQNFKQRDNFLTGIENVDYSKQEQIDFTFVYYGKYLRQVLEKEKNLAATVKRLENYQKLMKVKRDTLAENRWRDYGQFRQFVVEGKK